MKLYTKLAALATGIALGFALAAPALPPIVALDAFEESFPLVRVAGPRVIEDLSYLRDDNFLGHRFYHKFGVKGCYVHRDMMPKMERLYQILERERLVLVLSDCFRPHEAQEYMWRLHPNPKFLANPNKGGSVHSKGLALDVALADERGSKLDFANKIDSFTDDDGHDFVCPKNDREGCDNRARLKRIMEEAGFKSIRHEWWHYQDGIGRGYPLIRVCGVVECEGV